MKVKISNYQLPLACALLVFSIALEWCEANLLETIDGEVLGGQLTMGRSGSRSLSKKKKKDDISSLSSISELTNGGRGILRSLLGDINVDTPFIPFADVDLLKRPYDHPICYDDDLYGCGPQNWGGVCATGTKQSPIDVHAHEAVAVKLATNPLTYNREYSEIIKKFYIANTGHSISIKISPDGTSKAEMHMSDQRLTYRFGYLHFHWGSDNSQGSEHKIEGQVFPLEMHFVHYMDVYDNTETAFSIGEQKAASVIAIFVDVGDDDNYAFQPIVDAILSNGKQKTGGYKKVVNKLKLYDLLPSNKEVFYRYEGSLTVPQCTEKVHWIVYPNPIRISREQMSAFRKVHRDYEDHLMSNNFRPVQPLNSRRLELFNFTTSHY